MTTTTPAGDGGAADDVRISAYSSCPEKTVFTERSNPDGWISTDLTVEIQP